MSKKILLDTDIGTDIDDAVCLAYLLANPECELLGITTVTGEAEKRGMIASAICMNAGKDIPIYPGAEKPLIIHQRQLIAQQAKALKKWKYQEKFPKGESIEFLRRTVRENPGEISLLTIGPLTNIALLFSIDPEIPSLLKELVMMCGYFFRKAPHLNRTEWNASGDYHASNIIFNSDVMIHRSVGLNVTRKIIMHEKEFKQIFGNELFLPVLDFAEIWFKNFYRFVAFHDPLAAVTIFEKNICEFVKGNVKIDLESKKYRGLTDFKKNPKGKHEVAFSVDKEKFFNHFISICNK